MSLAELKRDSTLEYTDLGKVWGVVGKICFFTGKPYPIRERANGDIYILLDGDWKLVVVTQASYVDVLPHGGQVYCVEKIGIISLTSSTESTPEIIGIEVHTGIYMECIAFQVFVWLFIFIL